MHINNSGEHVASKTDTLPLDIIKNYRIRKGNKFRLADLDPGDTYGETIGAEEAEALLAAGVKRLATLQERLFAEHRWAILIILRRLDAGMTICEPMKT